MLQYLQLLVHVAESAGYRIHVDKELQGGAVRMEPGSAQWGERLKLEHFHLNRRKNFAVWVTEQ